VVQDRPQALVRPAWMLAALLVLPTPALLWEAWHTGMTADEGSHLTAGYMYWLGHDELFPSDTPPLMRIISGWIPRLTGAPSPLKDPHWRTKSSYDAASQVIESRGAAAAHGLLFFARLPFIVFPLLTTFLIWIWGQELFGSWIGLFLASCAALEPTLLGHGPLIKSDEMVAFGCLLFTWRAYRFWRAPGIKQLVLMTAAIVLALLAKFTALTLIPIALLVVLWKSPGIGFRLGGAAVVLGSVYLGILLAYQFRTGALETSYWQSPLETFLTPPEMSLVGVLSHVPWPTQFVRGLRFIGSENRNASFTGYAMGHRIIGSYPLYYLLALAVKFPIPLQILSLAGLAAAVTRALRGKTSSASVFIWGTAAFLLSLAIVSHMHIGFRHIMPVLPLAILGGGFALQQWSASRWGRFAAVVLLVWLIVSSVRVFPQGISYFNEWAGGPENGLKFLADSNLDWGQNLPELARYVSGRALPEVKLYYFGNDSVWFQLPAGRFTLETPPQDASAAKQNPLRPAPGIYAISANYLAGFLLPQGLNDYFAYFRGLRPIGRAGYSILIYRVTQ